MAKLHFSALSLLLATALIGCQQGASSQTTEASADASGAAQAAPTPGGAKAATYSPDEVCFSNEEFEALTKIFPDLPEEAAKVEPPPSTPEPAPAADSGTKAPPAESPEAAMKDAQKNAKAAQVPAAEAAAAAAPADTQSSAEIAGIKILKGRKDYCCHSPTGGAKPIRASNSASAILKCKKHAPLGWVSKGPC